MENLNKRKLIPSLASIVFCFSLSTSANAVILLDDYGFNLDGSVTYPFGGDSIPAAIDNSAFNDITGLGTIDVTITGNGIHYFAAIFDHDIDEAVNTFFNESGSVSGNPAAGQSWEIDEPEFLFGDIYTNFEASTLDNSNGVPAGAEDDVSMAMGWDFTLANGETALIMLMLGTIQPTSGFFLEHNDPDSDKSIYLSSTLGISLSPIPVPAAIWLFGSGLLGLIGFSRRKAKANNQG